MKNWMEKNLGKRLLAMVLCLSMVLSMAPVPSFAEGCTHHPEHTADCGYVAAVQGQPCAHQHDASCGYQEAAACAHQHDGACGYREAVQCNHVCGDGNCGYAPKVECNHVHTEECGENGESCIHSCGDGSCAYFAGAGCDHSHNAVCGQQEASPCTHSCADGTCGYREARDCTHQHDESCGYREAVEGKPCTFVCQECSKPQEPEPPATPVCSCENKCVDGNAIGSCQVCAANIGDCTGKAPETPEICTHGNALGSCETCASEARVAAVQAQINALPEEVTAENKEAVQTALAEVDTAKSALNETEQGQLDVTKYTALTEKLAALEAELNKCAHGNDPAACEACESEARVAAVQAQIDALPEEVTAETKEAAQTALAEVDTAKSVLTADELAKLDNSKYTALAEKLAALEAELNKCAHGNDPATCEACKSEARVAEVQAQIDALPKVEELTEDTLTQTREQLATVKAAVEELTPEEQAQLTLEKYTALTEYFAALDKAATEPTEPEPIQITSWQWIDEWEIIDVETGLAHLPFASAENIAYYEAVLELLPWGILADGVELTLGEWTCEDYPQEGAYTGQYIFETTLPEGYAFEDGTNKLTLKVILGDPEGEGEGVPAVAYAGSTSTHSHCVCGATHSAIGDHTNPEAITWEPYSGGETYLYTLSSGNYYLDSDIYINDPQGKIIISKEDKVNICLNGHTIYGARTVFDVDGELNITDCQGGGQIFRNKLLSGSDYQCAINISNSPGVCRLYGGVIHGFPKLVINEGVLRIYNANLSGNSGDVSWGGGISNEVTGCIYMYGGTIQNCHTVDNFLSGGGGVYNSGIFYMSGGTIYHCWIQSGSGGKTSRGTGVYNVSGSTFIMDGGTITGCYTRNSGFEDGYAVYCEGNDIKLGGSAKIYGNTRRLTDGSAVNANLMITTSLPTVKKAFNNDANICVTLESGHGPIANVAPGVTADISHFTPDDASTYEVQLKDGRPTLVSKALANVSLDTSSVFLSPANNYRQTVTILGLGENYDTSKIQWKTAAYSDAIRITPNGNTCEIYDRSTAPSNTVASDTITVTVENVTLTLRAVSAQVIEDSSVPATDTLSYKYDGSPKGPSASWGNLVLTTGGTMSATVPGKYTLTLTPTANYCWEDGTRDTRSINWEIVKGTVTSLNVGGGIRGQKLSTVALPDGWQWVNPDQVLPFTWTYWGEYEVCSEYYENRMAKVWLKKQDTAEVTIDQSLWKTKRYTDEFLAMNAITLTAKTEDGDSVPVTDFEVASVNGKTFGYNDAWTTPLEKFYEKKIQSFILRYGVYTVDVTVPEVSVYTKIQIPTLELPYNGQSQTPFKNATTLKPYEKYCVECIAGDYWATDIGSHSVTLKPTEGNYNIYAWPEDYSQEEKTFTWKIVQGTGAVTFAESIDKTYTSQPVVLTPGTDYTVTGDGDANVKNDVTVEYKVRDAADDSYTTVAPTAIGKYTVRVSVEENTHYTAASATKDFEIKGIPVTISGEIQTNSKVYDGTNTATFNCEGVTLQGVAEGADVQLSAEGHFTDVKAGESVSAVITKLSLKGTDAGRYELQVDPLPAPAPAAITAKPLSDSNITVTLTGNTPVYDGTEKTQSVTVQFGEITLVENTDYTLSNNTGTGAGSYTLTVTLTGNYSGSKDQGWEIAKASISPKVEIKNTVYGEKLNPSVSSNPENGNVTYTYYSDEACTTEVTPKNVGTYYVKATVAETTNYRSGTSEAVSFQITKKALTVKAEDHTITYGDAPANDGVSYDGFVNRETEDVLGGTLAYDYSYSQYGNVGDYTITPKGLTSDNYDITFADGKLTVEQREIGIDWGNTSLPYTGKAQAPTATATGWVNDDACTITITGQKTEAGSYTATASSLSNNNYKLPESNTCDFSITKIAPEFTAPTAKVLTYTGQAQALIDDGSTSHGTMRYRLGTAGQWSTEVPTGTNAGSYTVWYQVNGDNNHKDSEAESILVTIKKAKPSITVEEDKKTYTKTYGDAAFTLEGITENSDDAGVTYAVTKGEDVVSVSEDGTVTILKAGEATITLSLPESTNYLAADSKTVTIMVNRKDGSVTITGDLDKTYDGQPFSLTTENFTAEGDGTVTIEYKKRDDNNYSVIAPVNAGDYTVKVTKAQGTNHNAAEDTQDFTIEKRPVTISGVTVAASKVYDGGTVTAITNSGTLSDNFDGEKLTIQTGSAAYDDKNVGQGKTVSFTGFQLGGDAKDNYTLTKQPDPITADISPKEITVTGAQVQPTKVYDGFSTAGITAFGKLDGVLDGDTVTIDEANSAAAYDSKNVGDKKTVTYSFALAGADKDNYTLKAQTTAAAITPKSVTLTVNVADKTFDNTRDAAIEDVKAEGFLSGDDVTVVNGTPAFEKCTPGTDIPVTFTDFTLEGADAGNYVITNPRPENVKGIITASDSYLDLTGEDQPGELEQETEIWIDGKELPVQSEDGAYVALPETGELLTTYAYAQGTASQTHENYYTDMAVYRIIREENGSRVEKIEELTDLLQYSGCSIRVNGNRGIRMITSLDQGKKAALTTTGLAGYTLVEYGTVVSWADALNGESLTLENGKHNYAYREGVSDPVFGNIGNLTQYTNVLVGFSLEECARDIAMRPYMILRDNNGQTVTLYGGCVTRSIGYIAWQNKDTYQPGTDAYNYVHELMAMYKAA